MGALGAGTTLAGPAGPFFPSLTFNLPFQAHLPAHLDLDP